MSRVVAPAPTAPERAEPPPEGGGWRPFRHWRHNVDIIGPLFLLPAVLVLVVLLAYPLVLGVWLSLTDTTIGREGVFVGLANFRGLVGDRIFLQAVAFTFAYTIITVLLKFVLGMSLALVLNNRIPFKAIFRAIVLLPWVVPTVLSAMAWWWIYDSNFSIISWALTQLGLIDRHINFLGDPMLARTSVIFVNIWRGIPFFAITLLAGLQTIPPSLYEAAAMDGVTGWQRFRYITMPMLSSLISIVVTFSVIFTFTDFQLVYAITRGGPSNSTHLMATLAFQRAIPGGDLSQGASIAILMFPILMLATLATYFAVQRRRW